MNSVNENYNKVIDKITKKMNELQELQWAAISSTMEDGWSIRAESAISYLQFSNQSDFQTLFHYGGHSATHTTAYLEMSVSLPAFHT